MASAFAGVFADLKPVLAKHAKRLKVKTDSAVEYTVVSKTPSPFPQHKGQPLSFGCVKVGKAYVSFHLLPLYMNPAIAVPPALKKRMQGKACFNFKASPEPELLAELKQLTDVALKDWKEKKWL